MGAKSQRKGREGERELAAILRDSGYDEVQVGDALNYGTIPDLTGLDGVHIECKRNERLNILDAMEQATRDAERFQDGVPCVFHRRNRSPWLVSMRLTDWLQLYEQWRK